MSISLGIFYKYRIDISKNYNTHLELRFKIQHNNSPNDNNYFTIGISLVELLFSSMGDKEEFEIFFLFV